MKKFSMILLVLLFGCKSIQTGSDSEPIIYMNKTACLGTCPDYDISIFSNGRVLLNARQFIEMEGTFEAKLSKESLSALISSFEEAGFDSFRKEYTSNRMDLPTTTLTYDGKTVVDYDGAPQALKDLESVVHELVEELKWKSIN